MKIADIIAEQIDVRLDIFRKRLSAAERVAHQELNIASLTSMEAAVFETVPELKEREPTLVLDRHIEEAFTQADEAEARWDLTKIAQFDTATQRLKECVAVVHRAVRRLREAAAMSMLALAVLVQTGTSEKLSQDPQEQTEQKNIKMPRLNPAMAIEFIRELPKSGQMSITSLSEGVMQMTRLDSDASPLTVLEDMQRLTAEAIHVATEQMPPDLLTEMAREINPSSFPLSLQAYISKLENLRLQGDSRAERLMEVMSKLTQRLDEIQESHEDALEPLFEIFEPAKEFFAMDQDIPHSINSPAGKVVWERFSDAMTKAGIRVEYISEK